VSEPSDTEVALSTSTPSVYRFGLFAFAPQSGELSQGSRRVRLEPQPAKLLELLLEQAGELVPRETVRQALWDEATHVDFDQRMAYCLRQVRAALRDDAANPRFIETLPKRGYRFIAPVMREILEPQAEELEAVRGEPASLNLEPMAQRLASRRRRLVLVAVSVLLGLTAILLLSVDFGTGEPRASDPDRTNLGRTESEGPAAAPTRPLLAVASFDNETGDEAHDLRVSAATDATVDRLTSLGADRIGVVGNAAVLRQPRELRDLEAIREQTGAAYVVLGQLQNDDAGLRLLLHLIQLEDGAHLWATRVVRPADQLEGLEAEAAEQLLVAVRERLVAPTADPQTTR
jgi:DNA-binding winged helix-turn-helix (wHTH) protein/TolB-like protein